ncbi:MAG: Rab family GTPase, partial [Candidatus Hodarchaeota archaeon]
MAEEYDYLFKSIVVGDGGVGKTALTLRFSKGFFTEDYKMTIGVDFHVKTISIDTAEGSIKCKLQLWDTGGQERFSSIRPMYYRGSLGVVLVYDVTNSSSFEHLPQWIEEVRANIKAEIPILLVGNKSDLADQRAVPIEEINIFTRDFNLYYMETSAKTGDGVGDCFYILACLMIGSDIPEQLIGNKTVFNPGEILIEAPSVSPIPPLEPEMEFEYAAPPVPEPPLVEESDILHKAEYEQQFEYAAPPVPEPIPEPESEFEYAAPPVPEPSIIEEPEALPSFEQDSEPEIPIPEPKEIEFKTPDEILTQKGTQKIKAPSFIPTQDISDSTSEESYKPKTIP